MTQNTKIAVTLEIILNCLLNWTETILDTGGQESEES